MSDERKRIKELTPWSEETEITNQSVQLAIGEEAPGIGYQIVVEPNEGI